LFQKFLRVSTTLKITYWILFHLFANKILLPVWIKQKYKKAIFLRSYQFWKCKIKKLYFQNLFEKKKLCKEKTLWNILDVNDHHIVDQKREKNLSLQSTWIYHTNRTGTAIIGILNDDHSKASLQ